MRDLCRLAAAVLALLLGFSTGCGGGSLVAGIPASAGGSRQNLGGILAGRGGMFISGKLGQTAMLLRGGDGAGRERQNRRRAKKKKYWSGGKGLARRDGGRRRGDGFGSGGAAASDKDDSESDRKRGRGGSSEESWGGGGRGESEEEGSEEEGTRTAGGQRRRDMEREGGKRAARKGERGIIFTANPTVPNWRAKAIRECVKMFGDYCEKLGLDTVANETSKKDGNGGNRGGSSVGSSAKHEQSARYIEDEIAALRAEFEAVDGLRANSEAENKTGFVVSKCESKGAIFIQFRGGSASPVALAEGVSAAAQQGMIFPKFVKRLMPCTKTCYASPEDAGRLAMQVLGPFFPKDGSPTVFAIEFERRANTDADRDEYIRAVAKAIDELGPNKVNLKNPQVVVSVQVLRTMCGIAASYNFTKLKRFSLVDPNSPGYTARKNDSSSYCFNGQSAATDIAGGGDADGAAFTPKGQGDTGGGAGGGGEGTGGGGGGGGGEGGGGRRRGRGKRAADVDEAVEQGILPGESKRKRPTGDASQEIQHLGQVK